ncbi:hypothetical protein M569_00001, partial [Genlisea aurea]
KISAIVVSNVNEVSDASLGLPSINARECLTCGANSAKECEGHFGVINFNYTILNPYYMPEIANILNKICPGCKSIRQRKIKKGDSASQQNCKYCNVTSLGYPKMKFRVSTREVFAKTAIIAEVQEMAVNQHHCIGLASDYWDIIPKDSPQDQSDIPSNRRVLYPSQVYSILKDVCPKTLEALLKRKNSIFLNSLLVTPNSHRVREFGGHITVDGTTRLYRKLTDFRGSANELNARVLERYKICSEKVSAIEKIYEKQSSNDSASSSSGLRNIKELILAKRTDNAFRMVVVGDPRLKVDEIGLPIQIAESVLISDLISIHSWGKLESWCDLMLYKKAPFSPFSVIRNGQKTHIFSKDMLQVGDSISRPISDGDIVLINRPPSIHQHSLLALSVKVLPIKSVIAINPLTCLPLRGDFDGDCLHGFVPQSLNSRVEIGELASLKKQLVNGQNGRSLMSLGQDSLTAAYLILNNSVTLNKAEFQQLQMFCSCVPILPAIVNMSSNGTWWTGKQLFTLLLPVDSGFDYVSSDVCIRKGELISSSNCTSWLRDADENLYLCLVRHCGDRALGFLNTAQEVLCEWLSRQGLSVSLSDLYISSDRHSRKNLLEEVYYGLQEAGRLSEVSSLMVDQHRDFLVEHMGNMEDSIKEHTAISSHARAELFQASVSASRSVFRDLQNLVYRYASNENSFISMLKSGSKGNLQKFVQHSMCVGLQHSLAPLSFSVADQLTCASWNKEKCYSDIPKSVVSDSYIVCSIVKNSFLEGLNPIQCFTHSLTSRDSSFSGHADVSGTICRRLMYFMRDLIIGYDGTVRNCYGNQVVQFNYFSGDVNKDAAMGGHPVGSLAGCAISEAAYSALDLPISALEPSPLLALKEVLECGVKRSTRCKTASLFLSKGLRRWAHGFEYGALEVKNHLERLCFSDIVSDVRICPWIDDNTSTTSPWTCNFYINKEVAKKMRLKMHSIVDALHRNNKLASKKLKIYLPALWISTKLCSEADVKRSDSFCIAAKLIMKHEKFSDMEILRDMVVPVLLKTVIKGFPEFKKVDILWKDEPNHEKVARRTSGELFIRVSMSEYCDPNKFWSNLVDSCLRIRNLIDWERSLPDDILDYSNAFGISSAWQSFVKNLHSSIIDTGKTILPEHLIVTANCLSATGEFVALNAKGLVNQRKEIDIRSPFNQATFLNPSDTFVKAAKACQTDDLVGSVEALSWGQTPRIGTGCQFDLIYKGKGHETAKNEDVYGLLISHDGRAKSNVKERSLSMKSSNPLHGINTQQHKSWLERLSANMNHLSVLGIKKISQKLKRILKEYPMDRQLSGEDKSTALTALQFHPRWPEKIGSGIQEIKVGLHPEHQQTCFILKRSDGTEEDFSYRKCINHALELVAPRK